MNQIMRLRRKATDDYGIKDSNNGYGHEKAFVNILEKWGTLHEAQLLPRSFGDGSLIKGQIRPKAIAQLVDNLPTVDPGPQVRQGLTEEGAGAPEAARSEAGAAHLRRSGIAGRASRAQPLHHR